MVSKRAKSKVADEIRRALKACGRSRYQISLASGVNQGALCRFAAGSGLRIESLEAVALALGLQIVVVKRESKGR